MLQRSTPLFRRFGAIATALLVLATLFAPPALAADPPGTIAYATNKALFSFRVDEIEGDVTKELFRKKGVDPCCPSFSPDGTKVMFLAFDNGKARLGVFDVSTGEILWLAGKKFNPDLGTWSPDSSTVAFQAFSKKKRGVWTAAVNAKGRSKLYSKRVFDQPIWNHDGTKVAFTRMRKNNKAQILYGDTGTHEVYAAPIDPALDSYAPAWSPANNVLAFQSLQGTEDGDVVALYTVDVDPEDAVPTKLTEEGESTFGMDWAPDGSAIVFDSCCQDSDVETIVSIAPDGTDRTELVADNDSEDVSSGFGLHGYSPDGSQIAYTTYDAMGDVLDIRLHTMDADGGNQAERTIDTEESSRFFLDWAPDSTSLLICEDLDDSGRSNILYLTGDAFFSVAENVPGCDADWGSGGAG